MRRRMDWNTSIHDFLGSMCDGEYDEWKDELHLQMRIIHAFREQGYTRLSQIIDYTEKDFLKIPKLGKGSVKVLMKYLLPLKADFYPVGTTSQIGYLSFPDES